MRLLLGAILAIGAPAALSSTAFADISICNNFKTRVHVSLAYEDGNTFHAAGWWAVDPNACRTANFPFRGTVLYYTADSDSFREDGKTVHSQWGNEKGLFVPRNDFEVDDADRSRSGAKRTMFSPAKIPERLQSNPLLITLRFIPGNTLVSMEPIAKSEPKPDPKPSLTSAKDISICNGFRARIRVAFAYEGSNGFHAEGWWAVDPNACRDVDFPFPGTVLYYAANSDDYRDGDNSIREHWGNKKELHVGLKDFDLENAGQSSPETKPVMFSLTMVSAKLQSKPIKITFRFAADGTTINMKAK